MASTLNNLYMKYCNRVQRYLENDAYYQYLLELIAAGKPTITQLNRVMDKTVDEKWLAAIEEAIPAIHEIIAHPRRFLKTVEEVKPVEKVKKIGPDTVQHLSSHTQYITGMRGGTIYPGKLLTVENEESIDLYENRFVNTLIRKLAEFIEKRTGALFWDTGDEEASLLRMESEVEDDYERIAYRLEITVHNKQTYLENDAGKLEVFKRIDRVRRVIADFRKSAFVAAMAETSPVRPPIQRTNQIVKDPNYRKCYDLWQFLERYDQVGYDIDVRETALDFDEDYLFQMYGNLAMNYTVFKSLLEKDQRRVTEAPKRRKSIKPKFVKQIVEEFVDDYDLPDVEIRRVIVEEVTKAQLAIERRTMELEQSGKSTQAAKTKAQAAKEKEREKTRIAKEKEKEKARLAREKEKAQEKARLAREKEREKARLAKEKELEKARLAKEKEKEKARIAREKEKEREKAKLAKAKELEKARIAREKEKEREKARLAKEKEQEKARIAREKAKAQEKARIAKEKEREKARAAKEREQEKARLAKEKAQADKPKPAARPKAPAAPPPDEAPVPSAPTALPSLPEEAPAMPPGETVLSEQPIRPAAPPQPETVPPLPEKGPAEPPAETTSPEPIQPDVPLQPDPLPPPPEEEPSRNPILNWIQRRRKRREDS